MREHSRIVLIITAYVAFIALGMPDGLLGVAWPSIRSSFSVPLDSAGLLLSAYVVGYLIASISSGRLVTHMGVGKILAVSCAVTGSGLIGYTIVPYWWLIILLSIAIGIGAGAIDSGINVFAAANFNEGLMQWLHASYGIGITLGPIIMTGALLYMNSWHAGYLVVGVFQILLSVCFIIMIPLWDQKTDAIKGQDKNLTEYKTPLSKTIRQPAVWLSVLLFFLYTGSEVSLGTWSYILFVDSRGINKDTAGLLVSAYWGALTIGRILAGIITPHIGVKKLVTYCLFSALAGAAFLWWNPFTIISLTVVPFIGLAIAPIFPALVSGTTQRVGIQFSANTIGLQMAAGAIGAAVIPGIVGILARQMFLEIIPVCLILLFLLLFILHSLSVNSISKY